MTYHFVKRPKFAIYNHSGAVEELFCKLCGSSIAGYRASLDKGSSVDGQIMGTRTVRFMRSSIYAEMKIEFEDGSFHVTSGCSNCLNPNLSKAHLKELHVADMEQDPFPGSDKLAKRVPKRIVIVQVGGGRGIQ